MARRATSLGPKSSLFMFFCFFCLFCFFSFPFFASSCTKPCFPLEKGFFLFIFECLPLFLLSLFWPPPFFYFSFSVSHLVLSFFLPSCLSFLLSLVFVFVSFFPFLSSLLLFQWKAQHQNIQLQFFFNLFSLFWFSVLFFFPIPFSYLCYFLILSYVFCSTSMFLFSKPTT